MMKKCNTIIRSFIGAVIIMVCVLAITRINDMETANEAFKRGDYEVAEAIYRELLLEEPNNAQVIYNLGLTMVAQQKPLQAIASFDEFRRYASNDEDKSRANYSIGYIYFMSQKYPEALAYFKKALQLTPQDEDSKYNYELTRRILDEQKEQEQEQKQEGNQNIKPSEYAKKLKKQADEMVAKARYKDAEQLMKDGIKKDETVQYYNDFIQRLTNIANIELK